MTAGRIIPKILFSVLAATPLFAQPLPWVAVDQVGSGFVTNAGERFVPWGFNYFRDERFRLMEEYWADEGPDGWAKVEREFRDMRRMGANVVRLHLQFGRFMKSRGTPNAENLARLTKLIEFAESLGIYLDITGLGTYRAADEPKWYRDLKEKERWAAQAEFWEAIAELGAGHSNVFAYNLMNEPLATASEADAWQNPNKLDDMSYVEYIDREPAGRKAPEIARAWIKQLTAAIRKHDHRHLITVGMIWVETSRPELWAGFPPDQVAQDLNFLAVHVYPERGKLQVALDSLARYQRVGRPVVVEETFPMNCSPAELREFIRKSRDVAGWLWQYWAPATAELRGKDAVVNGLLLSSFALFEELNPNK